jgi:hypothetical protein
MALSRQTLLLLELRQCEASRHFTVHVLPMSTQGLPGPRFARQERDRRITGPLVEWIWMTFMSWFAVR